MSAPASWLEANQSALSTSVAAVRAAVERAHDGDDPRPSPSSPDEPLAGSALATLTALFGLSRFERDVLVLCAAVELDGAMPGVCAAAHNDPGRPWMTFGLALATFTDSHWSALTPASPLRHWELVRLDEGSLTRAPLRIDERVLHHLAGVEYLDPRLAAVLDLVPAAVALSSSQRACAERLARHFQRAATAGGGLAQLVGPSLSAREAVAAAACDALGCRLYALASESIPHAAGDQDLLLRLWQREVVLEGRALLVDGERIDDGDRAAESALARFVDRLRGAVVVSARHPLRSLRRASLRLDVGLPEPGERSRMWDAALGGMSPNGALDQLVNQFAVDLPTIESAVADALGSGAPPDPAALPGRLWDACRRQARPRLDDLAQRIEPRATWEDLVLPERQRALLEEVIAHVRHRSRVYDEWGFRGKSARGLGIAALFAGASGTGKTMAAEVLAGALRFDLYRIDLSAVVSKYIGETEKNLRRVFDAAEDTAAVLVFDEADALFGKRTEVKDSHDRYANIEVSYLLQRVEEFRGLTILTTNLRNAIDTAFLRRLRFVVEFPFPNPDQRLEIWRRVFPLDAPLDGVRPERLARLNVAGGNIRNIALNAAFLAADAGQPVTMTHLLRATRSEYAKLEQSLSETETAGWT